jgi:hypothetical protein
MFVPQESLVSMQDDRYINWLELIILEYSHNVTLYPIDNYLSIKNKMDVFHYYSLPITLIFPLPIVSSRHNKMH